MGFTFGGRSDTEFKISTLSVERGLLAPTRESEISIPGRHGVWDFGAEFDKRLIKIECAIVGANRSDLITQIRNIAEWLNPLKGAQALIFDDEPDKYYKARYSGQADLETIVRLGRFSLQFLCADPFAYAVADDVFTYNAAGNYNFVRSGTATSYPKIEIQGTCSGNGTDKITVNLNNKIINFTGTLSAGEILTLDSDTISTTKTSGSIVVSVLNNIDNLDFPVALPGANTFDVSVSGAATVTEAKVTCRSRWY